MKGTYVLFARLDSPRKTRIGSLGFLEFEKGYYAYVGSGMKSLEKRIERHFSTEKKRYWHIDYFLAKGGVTSAVYFESGKIECELARKLAEKFEGIAKFGCSDCSCRSHLFYSVKPMEEKVLKIIRSLQGFRFPLRISKFVAS
jgi:Uri superfamily endonuclease